MIASESSFRTLVVRSIIECYERSLRAMVSELIICCKTTDDHSFILGAYVNITRAIIYRAKLVPCMNVKIYNNSVCTIRFVESLGIVYIEYKLCLKSAKINYVFTFIYLEYYIIFNSLYYKIVYVYAKIA